MTELAMRRVGNKLTAVDPISEDEIKLIPTDRDVLVTWKTPRNIKQHRLAWALAEKVSEACDWLPDRTTAMDWLKVKARHVNMLQDPRTGQVAIVPKSIAFASLSQAAFSRVLNRMIWVTCNEIVVNLDEGALRAELEAMTADNRGTK